MSSRPAHADHQAQDRRNTISARSLVKTFGHGETRVTALDNIDVDIRENEFFTLLGPSGCGKTTLLRLIAGFELPTGGTIELEGKDITALPPHLRPVNTVFQNYALFPHMTVAENVGFGLKMLGKPSGDIDARVKKMLSLVQLEAMANRRTDQLSGGQQQRVALARALAPAPKVLLLDEPLAALDLKLRKNMQLELKSLQHETGITFVFVTHDQEEALTMSDRIAVMRDGAILQIGSPKDIYDRPTHRFVADFIGDINIFEGTVESTEGNQAKVRLRDGETVLARMPEAGTSAGSCALAVRPESLRIAGPGEAAALEGTLENVVYMGAAHNLHLRLGSGEELVVRHGGSTEGIDLSPGAQLGVVIAPGGARVLA